MKNGENYLDNATMADWRVLGLVVKSVYFFSKRSDSVTVFGRKKHVDVFENINDVHSIEANRL